MTARLVTTLGAVALGLAAFAVSPVMAQGAGGGGGGGGGNVPSGTPSTTNAGAGHTGPDMNATKEPTATTGTMGQGMVRPMHHGHMASSHPRHMEHHASMHSHGRMGATDSGDAAVNRLNEQSLMAAQKGTNFMPGGMHQ